MNTFKEFLGYWEYTHGTSSKYYRVIPDPTQPENYLISWGVIGEPPRGQIGGVKAMEAFRRIRTKQMGGYTLKEPYTGTVLSTALLSLDDVRGAKRENIMPRKNKKIPVSTSPKSVKKGFSFVEWVENTSEKP